MIIPNSGMQGALFPYIKNKVYELAEGLKELPDSTKDSWRKYVLVGIYTLNNLWEGVVIQHESLLKNRELYGFNKFDSITQISSESESESFQNATWTQEDETYLQSIYEIVNKIVKYGHELQNGTREIVWNITAKDVTILGTEDEPIILITDKNDFAVINFDTSTPSQIIDASYVSGYSEGKVDGAEGKVDGADILLAIALVSVITYGVVLLATKVCDTIRDHLARAEAADIRRQQEKVYNDQIKSGKTPEQATDTANKFIQGSADAINSMEKSRAENKQAPDPTMAMIRTVALSVLGITAIGGIIYVIYKFTGNKGSMGYGRAPVYAGAEPDPEPKLDPNYSEPEPDCSEPEPELKSDID